MSEKKITTRIKNSERRMAENEVVFRRLNEQVKKDFKEIEKISKEAGVKDYPKLGNNPLHFYCECYDENCTERIILKPDVYTEIHQKRDRFIVIPDHNASEIEKIVSKNNNYWIVDKKFAINQKKSELQKTPKTVS